MFPVSHVSCQHSSRSESINLSFASESLCSFDILNFDDKRKIDDDQSQARKLMLDLSLTLQSFD